MSATVISFPTACESQEIFDKLQNFPAHLNLKNQGLFAIGYYHQRQDIFTKKTPSPRTGDTEE